MSLINFSLTTPKISPGILLSCLETVIPKAKILQVMTRLFELIAKPLATLETPGAFLNGLRLMAIDGTVFDIPETANVC